MNRQAIAFFLFAGAAIGFLLAAASTLGRGFTVNERFVVDVALAAVATGLAVLNLR